MDLCQYRLLVTRISLTYSGTLIKHPEQTIAHIDGRSFGIEHVLVKGFTCGCDSLNPFMADMIIQ
jgi:hypothetical protein